MSSILDSDREVERISREDLTALRGRFRSDPMKADEVTHDQVSVLAAVPILAEPFDQRGAMKFTSYFLDHTGAWRCNEIPGPDSFLGG